MADFIDTVNFDDLARQNPDNVCKRALCRYDNADKCYILSVWGDDFAIYPYARKIELSNLNLNINLKQPHEYLYVFIINYLLQAQDKPFSGEWISEKEIQGGSTFFRGPHEIPTNIITSRFKNNLDQFKNVLCGQLGGTLINMADAAYCFDITSRIKIAVLYWQGDEDFEPESKILYDKSISGVFALDVIFALAVAVCEKIGKR